MNKESFCNEQITKLKAEKSLFCISKFTLLRDRVLGEDTDVIFGKIRKSVIYMVKNLCNVNTLYSENFPKKQYTLISGRI